MGHRLLGHECCAMLSHLVMSNSAIPGTGACQAPLSMGLSRQECWGRLPCPPPGDLLNPGIKPRSPTLQADSLLSEPPGKPFPLAVLCLLPHHLCPQYRYYEEGKGRGAQTYSQSKSTASAEVLNSVSECEREKKTENHIFICNNIWLKFSTHSIPQVVKKSWSLHSPCNVYTNRNHRYFHTAFSSVQFHRSVVSNSLRPHESQHVRPPVHRQLLEFTQTHIHRVCDAIQPSHPLSSPSPPASNPSQHQGLFQ